MSPSPTPNQPPPPLDPFRSTVWLTEAQRKDLSDQVNALAEPLSQLTHTVLGVGE